MSGTKPKKYTEKLSTITIQISVLHRGHTRCQLSVKADPFRQADRHMDTHTLTHMFLKHHLEATVFYSVSRSNSKTFKFTSPIYIIVSLWVTFISVKCCRLPPIVAADSCVTQSACSVTLTPSLPEPQGWKWQISTCRFLGITCARVPVPLRGKAAAR